MCGICMLSLCNSMDCSPPGPSVHGILQARILEWAAVSSSRGPSRLRMGTVPPALAGEFFTAAPPGKPHGEPLFAVKALSLALRDLRCGALSKK